MEEGAVGCFDMTFEAAVSKLFYLLSKDKDSVKVKMKENIAGEISI
jgi:L-asparaginase/Glu-tRNA(Gln) amidotransferase subunit D